MGEIMQTPYGVFAGITSVSRNESGQVSGVMLEEKNAILTHAGELIPFYSDETPRRKYKDCVTFYQNGMIKSVSLDAQQEVITPVGELPAEFVTFYDTGELKRVFILDGKISGFWSEEEEKKLNIPLTFEFDFTAFTAFLVGICFYRSGQIKSVTLFPGETIEVETKYGVIIAKNGFSLYEDGNLKSVEPYAETLIPTPVGTVSAFDINAIGVNADSNSLEFDQSGNVKKLVTSNHIIVQKEDGETKFFSPITSIAIEEEEGVTVIPLTVEFGDGTVTITDEKPHCFLLSECKFNSINQPVNGCTPDMCKNCSLCQQPGK